MTEKARRQLYNDENFEFEPNKEEFEGGHTKTDKDGNANADSTLQLTNDERDIVIHHAYGQSDEIMDGL